MFFKHNMYSERGVEGLSQREVVSLLNLFYLFFVIVVVVCLIDELSRRWQGKNSD